jgi:hypothetical protein
MKREKLLQSIPLFLLGALLLIALISVFTQADTYGITIDEALQDQYGRSLLAWYQTWGHDRSFLMYRPNYYMPQHGAIFETIVAWFQHRLAPFWGPWHTRAVVSGLAGVVGIGAMALCGWELAGRWGALLAALSLYLYPRFMGAIFNNSKDVPFTVATILVLWSVLLLARQWEKRQAYLRNSALVGFLIGLAASVRVNAVLWYPILLLLFAGWWLHAGKRMWKERKVFSNLRKQAGAAVLIGGGSLGTMCLCWPYILLNPLVNLYDSVMVMRKYPWTGGVPFAGQTYIATRLPRSFAPWWLFIASPPAVIVFASLGLLFVSITLLQRKSVRPDILIIGLALFFPLALIMGLRATLYDSLRQFLFLTPPLLLLAVYGFLSLFRVLREQKKQVLLVGLILLTLLSQGQVVKDMYDIHPYEYTYFSPLIGGIPGASGKYEMDYWGICNKPAAEWLAQNYRRYTDKENPTVTNAFSQDQIMLYLPNTFRVDGGTPDFYISLTRFDMEKHFSKYKVIHQESVQGHVTCVVKVKN